MFLVSRDSAGIFTVKNDKHKDIDKLAPFYLEGREVEFVLPDGSLESNIALFLTKKQSVTSSGSVYQDKALEILLERVGIGGSMSKKDLVAHLGYDSSNAARDIYKPLEDGGFISSNRVQVTLIKTSDFDI